MPEEIEIDPREMHENLEEIRHGHHAAGEDWTRFISLSTAILAVVAAVAALQSGTLVNEALLDQGEAVKAQAQASDKWAEYQAKGIKGNTARQTADLLSVGAAQTEKSEFYRKEAERYKEEQKELRQKAEEGEKEVTEKGEHSAHFMHQHHTFAYCVTFTQVAIALSAIAALTKRRPVWYGSMAVGAIGLGFLVAGFLAH